MNKKLVKFLRKRGFLVQYCVNMNRNLGADDKYLFHVPENNLISAAFSWRCSPEGHDFWEDVDRQWRQYLQKHKK